MKIYISNHLFLNINFAAHILVIIVSFSVLPLRIITEALNLLFICIIFQVKVMCFLKNLICFCNLYNQLKI